MLTPIVSFATSDTTSTGTEEETTAGSTTDTASTTGTTAATNTNGITKKETGVGFIDKINPSALSTDGMTQEKVDTALNYLVASTAERRAMAYEMAKKEVVSNTSLEADDKVFDTTKTIDGHLFVTESTDYELYVEPSTFSIIIRDKNTGTLLRSTLEDEEAYVRSTTAPKYSMLTSGVTILPVKYDPKSESRSGMYDKSNLQASSRDAEITYDVADNGIVAHLNFNNNKNDLTLKGLNIQFDVQLTLDDTGLHATIPDDSINENYIEDDICFLMGDVYLFPLFGYTDRGDTDGYMLLPDGNGIIVNFEDFYQDGTAKYKSGYNARVYGTDVSLTTSTSSTSSTSTETNQEREDLNPVEEVIAPYFGMVHNYSSLNNGSNEDNIAVLGIVLSGEYNCTIRGSFNGVESTFENYAYSAVTYREIFQQPTDNSGNSAKIQVTDIITTDYEISYLFASGEEANYAGLANKCRDLLLEQGVIGEPKDVDYDTRIEFLGLDKENFLLFRRNVVATTIENMDTILQTLKENGVEDISAYYDGWQKGGMYNLPNTDYKVDGDLGGTNAMTDLVEKYADSGIDIYLLQDLLRINDTTSGSAFTAMHLINQKTYEMEDKFLNVYQKFKYLTPATTTEYMQTLSDNMSKEGVKNVAMTGFTDTLSSYAVRSTIHSRKDAMEAYTTGLEAVIADGMNVALDDPSMYLWKYTDKYLNMPISSSMYVYTSDEVPFLTSVLKGSMKIYSEYVNFEANQTEFFLKLIETGVYPSYLLTFESPTVLQYTNSSWNYSSDYKQYMEVISEFNDALKAVNEKTSGAYIVNHEKNYDGETDLTKVTYSNGVVVYVNFSEDTVSADGTTIDGLSYKVGEE